MKILKFIGGSCLSVTIILVFSFLFILYKISQINFNNDPSFSAERVESFKSDNALYHYEGETGFTDICNRAISVVRKEELPNFTEKFDSTTTISFMDLCLKAVDINNNYSFKPCYWDDSYKEYKPDTTLVINLNNSVYEEISNYKDPCTPWRQTITIYDYTNKLQLTQYYSCDGC